GASPDVSGCTFVGRRQQHPGCHVEVRLDPGSARAGVSVRLDEAHHYDFEVCDGQVEVVARIGPLRHAVARRAVPPGPVVLAVTTRTDDLLPPAATGPHDIPLGSAATGPDTIAFRLGDDLLAELDGRYLSTEVAGGFTGRVIGMYVTEGSAAFDWFEYREHTAE
ncbi:MAG: glycoside hydrolase family 43 protein, partial [Saccharothrix sp.]|nr:glycoside hydrolase family 43 protein [Saccharothrix sp.]